MVFDGFFDNFHFDESQDSFNVEDLTELPQGFNDLEEFFRYCEDKSKIREPYFGANEIKFLRHLAGLDENNLSEYATMKSEYGESYRVPYRKMRKLLNLVDRKAGKNL